MLHMIERFKQLPKPIMFMHVLAKLLLGLAIGLFAVQYLHPYGWWLILAAIVLAFPIKYRVADVIRTFSPRMLALYTFTVIIFGVGLGVVFACKLAVFEWYILAAALAMSIPGTYLMFKK